MDIQTHILNSKLVLIHWFCVKGRCKDVLKYQIVILVFSVAVLDTIKSKLFWYDIDSAILRLTTKITMQGTMLHSAASLLVEIFPSLNGTFTLNN